MQSVHSTISTDNVARSTRAHTHTHTTIQSLLSVITLSDNFMHIYRAVAIKFL